MKYNKKSILIIAVILILICIAGIFGLSRARNTKNISENNLKTSSKVKKYKTDSMPGKNNSDKEKNKNKTKVESSKVVDSKSTSDTDSQSSESGSDKTSGGSNCSNKGNKASNSHSNNSVQSKKTKVWIVDSPAKDAVYESVPQWGERHYYDVRVEANTSLNKRFYNKAEFSAYEDMLFDTRSDEELDSYHYYVGDEKYITGYKQVVVTPAQPEQGHWEWK